VLLTQLAHHVLLWARGWLAGQAPRVRECGIVRLVQEVWAVPGRVKVVGKQLSGVRLRRDHPRARDVCSGFRPLLGASQTLGFWRYILASCVLQISADIRQAPQIERMAGGAIGGETDPVGLRLPTRLGQEQRAD
jgi:hypothetical protein